MKITSNERNSIEIDLMLELLDEAAAQEYSLYSEIMMKILKAVPAPQLKSILDEFENIVYGG